MAWTASTFKVRYPEFNPTSDALVDAVLAEAVTELDARVFGASYATAVALLAAHKLTTGPSGQTSRLASDMGDSTYRQQLQRLKRTRAGGAWSAGQKPDGSMM